MKKIGKEFLGKNLNKILLLVNLLLILGIVDLWTRPEPVVKNPPAILRIQPIVETLKISTASWYDYDLEGYPGYSKNNLTAASREYPRGTFLRVCRITDGKFPPKCIKVRVNDYGPEEGQAPERHIDLSSAAFKELAHPKLGLIKVTIQTSTK